MKYKLYIYKCHIALAFGILLFLSGCQSAELKALENSASIIRLTTGREVSRGHQDKGVKLGKPVYAQVIIDYEPVNNFSKKDVYDEIVATLVKSNWDEDETNIVPDYFTASLQLDHFRLFASVLMRPHENLVTLYLEAH